MNTGSKRAPLLLDKGTPSFTFLTNYDFKSSILLLHVQVMFFMVTMPFQCLVLDDPVNQAWHKMLDDSHNKKICNSIRNITSYLCPSCQGSLSCRYKGLMSMSREKNRKCASILLQFKRALVVRRGSSYKNIITQKSVRPHVVLPTVYDKG